MSAARPEAGYVVAPLGASRLALGSEIDVWMEGQLVRGRDRHLVGRARAVGNGELLVRFASSEAGQTAAGLLADDVLAVVLTADGRLVLR